MTRRSGCLAWLLAASLIAIGCVYVESGEFTGGANSKFKGKGIKPSAKGDVTDIYMEVEILQIFESLELTPSQLDLLAALAKECREKARVRKPTAVSPEYRRTLLALHAALVENDTKKSDELQTRLETLGEKEEADFDDVVDVTDAARKKVFDFLRQLRVAQVQNYLETIEIEDPGELIEKALKASQGKKAKRWLKTRDDTALAVAHLLGGVNKAKSESARQRVLKFLDRAHALTPAEFAEQQASLKSEAQEIAGKVTPLELIRNQVEWNLAEMLSNRPERGGGALQGESAQG